MGEPTTKQIGKWYREVFESLDKSIPLDDRYATATKVVEGRIKLYKRAPALDEYLPLYPYQTFLLKKIWEDELGEH